MGTGFLFWLLPQRTTRPLFFLDAAIAAVLYLSGLVYLSWPLRRYRTALHACLSAWTSYAAVGVINWMSVIDTEPLWVWIVAWASHVLCAGIAPYGMLCATIFVHNRCWPAYPEGHCGQCGYDLTGNTLGVCPECGTGVSPKGRFASDPLAATDTKI